MLEAQSNKYVTLGQFSFVPVTVSAVFLGHSDIIIELFIMTSAALGGLAQTVPS